MAVAGDARQGSLALADRRDRRRGYVAAARTMEPLYQGAFDGFCGLYAVINALRLALAAERPLSHAQCEALFRHGVRFLHAQDRLHRATSSGINVPWWRRLAAELVRAATTMVSVPVELERPLPGVTQPSWEQTLWSVRTLIDLQAPVLTVLRGAYRHYSVVVGYTPTRLMLFDSWGYAWINLAACSTTRCDPPARHRLDPGSIMALRVERSPRERGR